MTTWHSLPIEMKFTVVDSLDMEDIKKFSKVDQEAYKLCIPATFRSVKLNSYECLLNFLQNVPHSYYHHIRHLEVCTRITGEGQAWSNDDHPCTNALASLLSQCYCLEHLSLHLAASLAPTIIPVFSFLKNLRVLSVVNCSDEESTPISERLVVAIAASITGLEQLSLDRISRSMLHAPELIGGYPSVPVVYGDENVPDHPTLGSELSLPSLLRISSLRKLVIRDTHLGDPRWSTTPVACRLETVDLGNCYHENDDYNRTCIERIMSNVGPTIDEFSLATAVSDSIFSKSSITPLRRLRKLHITPYFPIDNVVETITTLAGSPIESLSMQCYEEDVVDVCTALGDFLSLRVERGPEFYNKLTRVDVSITAGDASSSQLEENVEGTQAVKRLQEFCRDLRLSRIDLTCEAHIGSHKAKSPANPAKSDEGCYNLKGNFNV